MAEQWIVIPEWNKFQHYKDRDPKWIKVYTRLLSDPAYVNLSFPQRGLLHGLWHLYARSARDVPDNTSYLSRQLGGKVLRKSLESLYDAGFIEFSSSKPLAETDESASPETYKEETEKEQPLKPFAKRPAKATLALVPFAGNELVEAQTAPWRLVYDHWAAVRVKPRARPTPKRTKAINTRLGRFSVAELCAAIDNVALDDWAERPKFDDIAILMRSDEQVERFLEMSEQRTAGRGYVTAAQVMAQAIQAHQEGR